MMEEGISPAITSHNYEFAGNFRRYIISFYHRQINKLKDITPTAHACTGSDAIEQSQQIFAVKY